MAVSDNQDVSAAVTNAAYVSKTVPSTIAAVVTLNGPGSGAEIENLQQDVNDLKDAASSDAAAIALVEADVLDHEGRITTLEGGGGGGGGLSDAYDIEDKSANFTAAVSTTAMIKYYRVDSSGGAITVTFPSAIGNAGKVIAFEKVSSDFNKITNGSTGKDCYTVSEKWHFASDGTDWDSVRHECDTDWQSFPTVLSSTRAFTFTIASSTVDAGDVYSHNNHLFVATFAVAATTTMYCAGTGAPLSSGTLTKVSGSGPGTIAFSSVTNDQPSKATAPDFELNVARRDGRHWIVRGGYYSASGTGSSASTGDYVFGWLSGPQIDPTYAPAFVGGTDATAQVVVPSSNPFFGNAASGKADTAGAYMQWSNGIPISPTMFRLYGWLNFSNRDFPFTTSQAPINAVPMGYTFELSFAIAGWLP